MKALPPAGGFSRVRRLRGMFGAMRNAGRLIKEEARKTKWIAEGLVAQIAKRTGKRIDTTLRSIRRNRKMRAAKYTADFLKKHGYASVKDIENEKDLGNLRYGAYKYSRRPEKLMKIGAISAMGIPLGVTGNILYNKNAEKGYTKEELRKRYPNKFKSRVQRAGELAKASVKGAIFTNLTAVGGLTAPALYFTTVPTGSKPQRLREADKRYKVDPRIRKESTLLVRRLRKNPQEPIKYGPQ